MADLIRSIFSCAFRRILAKALLAHSKSRVKRRIARDRGKDGTKAFFTKLKAIFFDWVMK
ncbi:hypothetical protein [Xanthomonas sp. GW]|uniref:hypothetical protein n=1 Tax=Xanthomonas sp. GW TaxID=2724121 RepID=UPI0016399C29|nr:hypothetical protein [Xanthomonas sp. GW]